MDFRVGEVKTVTTSGSTVITLAIRRLHLQNCYEYNYTYHTASNNKTALYSSAKKS